MTQPYDDPSPDSDNSIVPDDSLPEVQPPSAGFIIQLFIIPGLIVLVIVMVWLMFTWLAHMGGDPRSYIAEMKLNKPNSWQQAYNLSESLRQNETYRSDAGVAKELADYLDQLMDQPLPAPAPARTSFQRDPRSEEIERRGFLVKALGEFAIADDALPVLIKAAGRHTNEDDLRIRLVALESIALLAENVRKTKPIENEALLPLLDDASRQTDHKIALRAAMALAAVGSDPALERLEQMLGEQHHVDVHFNAATGLARWGNPACIEVLTEMLDPQAQRGVAGEPNEQDRAYKRAVILLNGLKATRMLAEANSEVDLSVLSEAIQHLLESDVQQQIRLEATSTQSILSRRR